MREVSLLLSGIYFLFNSMRLQGEIENARRKTAYANKQDAQFFERGIEDEGEVRGFEAIMLRRDGTQIEIIENARAVDYANGERCIEGTISDITERKQAERRARRFAKLDADGDGYVTADEHAAADKRMDRLFERVDTDGDGVMSMEELQVAYPTLSEDLFAAMDANGDGSIDADEFQAAQDAAVLPVTDG